METPLTPLEFARRARKLYPARVAVIDGGSRWTYAQFFDRCDRWSAVLQKLRIGSRDRVAYLSPNTHAQLESFYAGQPNRRCAGAVKLSTHGRRLRLPDQP